MDQLDLVLGNFGHKTHIIPVYMKRCHIPADFTQQLEKYKPVGHQVLRIDAKQLQIFNSHFNGDQVMGRVVNQNRLYVIDPKGYVIIYYVDATSVSEEYQDLSYLISHNPVV